MRGGKILLANYVEKGYWFLPGGHIELGESGASALVRECKEEMSIDVSNPKLLTTFEHAYEDKGEIQHEITLIYKYEAQAQETIESQIPHLAFEWITEDRFDEIKFLPKALKDVVRAYMDGEPMPQFASTLQ